MAAAFFAWTQQKTPPPVRQWGLKFSCESKPNCRAGQQRVRKQQVQIVIHGLNLANGWRDVKCGARFNI
jgi:hypothetical protein